MSLDYQDFENLDLRCGTIVKAEEFPRAKKPAYKVWVDFGPAIGIKQTSAQITVHYRVDALIGKQVIGCLNLGTRNIAGFISEFLLLGFSDERGAIALAGVDLPVPNGMKLH